jgi:restriction system protein
MHTIPSQSQPGPVDYIPRVVSALRDMDGVAKASAVRDAIVASMTEQGEPFNETILSTGAIKYQNDIAWARMYLVNAGMLEPVSISGHGIWKLTQAGWAMPLDVQTAIQIYNQPTGGAGIASTDTQDAPSDDALQQDLPGTDSWEHQLKKILKSLPPEGFERLCAAIMTANGLHATKVNGHSGDKGIDGEGLLSFDKAGLVSIRVAWQCKRFKDGSVGSDAVRNFRGSLDHATAHGIIFTTSAFTPEAVQEAAQLSKQPIKLVHLGDLIGLLQQFKLGVSALPVNAVDVPFFDEYLHPVVSNPTKSLLPWIKAAPSATCS